MKETVAAVIDDRLSRRRNPSGEDEEAEGN
jgi:hypothetical protein